MRWKRKTKPKHRDKRVVRRFLWFPRTFNDETRWLEFANLEQIYLGREYQYRGWRTARFKD